LGHGKASFGDIHQVGRDNHAQLYVFLTHPTFKQVINVVLVNTANIMGIQVWSEDMLRETRAEFETVNVRATSIFPRSPAAINTLMVSIIRSDICYIRLQ
jgi:hypothetical protein